MSVEELSVSNEKLRNQIHELKEEVACLDTENRELLNENRCIKDQNQHLQATAGKFKATMEQMQKKVEDIRERMDEAQMRIEELENQNKSLLKGNEELNKELQEVSFQMALFQDYKEAQEKDLLEMQNLSTEVRKHLKTLEDKLDETERNYYREKRLSCHLQEKVAALLLLRESQRKGIKDLQAQLETSVQQATIMRLDEENRVQVGSLMHEVVEAKLVDVALNKSKMRRVMQWLCKLGKILVILVVGCSVLLFLIFMYTYFYNEEFISDMLQVFLSEENITKLAQGLSYYLTWRNEGLLPF
ncbi:keratin, type I cytoskeletal 39-like [Anolis carolinensis]|uniref:keratin, type I cytoskeletal 39-like n=1 Tax=Anolis carolinensis TaxID=28377 RepID=UPI000203A417